MLTKKGMLAFLRGEEGLTTVEYAIAGGLVGAGVIGAFMAAGRSSLSRDRRDRYWQITAIVIS